MLKITKKSAQDIQDDIFRKMSADEKIKLGSDFSTFILKHRLPQYTKISMIFLKKWLKKEKIFAKFKSLFE